MKPFLVIGTYSVSYVNVRKRAELLRSPSLTNLNDQPDVRRFLHGGHLPHGNGMYSPLIGSFL